MICKKCETENPEESQFCSKCGNCLKAKKKKINNIFALLSLVFLIIGLLVGNFVISVISLISSFILAIIGIIKSSKVKKEIGKRKGLAMSIIILILSILIGMLLMLTIIIESLTFSVEEQIVGQYVKTLKNSLYDIDSFKLNNVILYKQNSENPKSFATIIDYSGKNLVGGTAREFIVFRYTYSNAYSSIGYYDSLEEAQNSLKTLYPSTMTTITKLDTNSLLRYSNNESTPMLKVNYDSKQVNNNLKNAIDILN